MPKLPIVSIEDMKNGLIEEIGAIIQDVNVPVIAVPSSEVWERLRDRFEHKVTTKYIYTIVKQNRYNVWDLLGIQEPINLGRDGDASIFESNDDSDTLETLHQPESSQIIKFTVTLSAQEWSVMKPVDRLYANTGTHKSAYVSNRNYEILQPFHWTHVINEHFWSHTKLPCSLKFKKARVSPGGVNYVYMIGSCSECNSTITGVIRHVPEENTKVLIDCQYVGNFQSNHSLKSKRNISGIMRTNLKRKLCDENVSAASYQRSRANALMDLGDYEPAHLPKLNQLRVCKAEGFQESRLHKDVIKAIQIAKSIPPLLGVIRDIGCDRFFVHYWSNAQMHVYKSYIRNSEHSKISIDATGGVSHKICYENGLLSGHIFLYDITVLDTCSAQQYSVSNMLSERHDTNSISFWLNEWRRDSAPSPKEIVTDMSLALLSAVTNSFTHFKNLSDYIRECSKIISGRMESLNLPEVFIRCDVAHVMKNIADWPCLKGQARRIRRFYIRCIAQLLQCTSLQETEILLRAINVVALSETERVDCVSGKITPCELAKELLQQKIATGKFTEEQADDFLDVCEMRDEGNDVLGISENDDDFTKASQPFKAWAEEITASSNDILTGIKGDRGNCQYLPTLVASLNNLMQKLPLVSAIMVPHYGFGEVTCSSAPVESNFGFVKHIMLNRKLPIRADDFIKFHSASIEGKMKLVAAPNAVSFMNRNIEYRDDSDSEAVDDVLPLDSIPGYLKTTNNEQPREDTPDNDHRTTSHSRPGNQEDEQHTLENWRNQALKPTGKSKKSTYLKPKAEWLHMDLATKCDPSRVIGIIKNGHRPGLQSIKNGEECISVANTCAFDSILQIMSVAYCDSPEYKSFVNENPNQLNEMIQGMNTTGVTASTYRSRAFILKDIMHGVKWPSGVLYIDSARHAGALAQSLFTGHPCGKETSVCSLDNTCRHGNKSFDIRVISIQFQSPKMDTIHLPAKLHSRIAGEETTCLSESSNCKCLGVRSSSVQVIAPHLVIEPNCIDVSVSTDTDVRDVFTTKLADFPTSMVIGGKKYFLRGVVAFISAGKTRHSVGHYVAHCLRSDDTWQLFDDLSDRVKRSSEKFDVNCHLVVYTV